MFYPHACLARPLLEHSHEVREPERQRDGSPSVSKPGERPTRTVLFISNWTGITAETLGHSLLTQFDGIDFRSMTVPFIRTADKAREVAEEIDRLARKDGHRPLVFSTLITDDARDIVKASDCLYIDFFGAFIEPLEQELGVTSSHASGRAHAVHDAGEYTHRIDAMNFALATDDGATTRQYGVADVVLVGVSRSGKTPTCLYLAMRYGVFAANYPLTAADLERGRLPAALLDHRNKLFGLTVDAERLQQLRHERRPGSRYASLRQARYEVKETLDLYQRYGIPHLDVTHCSVEEIASTVLDVRGLQRRLY